MFGYGEELDLEQSKSDSKTMELSKLMTDLADEYEEKINTISTDIKKSLDSLNESNIKLSEVKRSRLNNSNLFSPNVKTYDMDEVNNEMSVIQSRIDQLTKEKERMTEIKNQLDESATFMEKTSMQKTNVGLNILSSQEKDRQRIARDLHDSTVQNLTGLVHKIELCNRLVDLDPTRAKLELMTMSNTVKSVINEMRDIIYNLRPMSLEDLGLVATIERYAKQLMVNHDIKINLKYNQENENILPVINLALYRVVQEACHNVIKHAHATKIDINIHYEENSLTITIQDNGVGFDIEMKRQTIPQDNSGYGLSIMKERVYLLSGTMEVHSEMKKGTKITITLPLMKHKGEENEQTN